MRLLGAYRWPGNVRQLENAVFRAVVLAESDEIGVAEFPQIATQVPGFEGFATPQIPAPSAPASEPGRESLVVIHESPATAPGNHGSGDALPLLGGDGHVRPMEMLEAEAIRFAIDRYRGRMTEVARRLKIGRSTLYRKLKELGYDTGAEAAEEGAPAHVAPK
jgi:DNA-binding NtrC family response regulator